MSLIKVKSRGTDNVSGRRNLIINGAMQIAQRGTSFSGGTGVIYLTDRWHTPIGSSYNLDTTITQSTTTPTGEGFKHSLKVEADSVQTPSGSHNGGIGQKLEGQDVQHFAWGTSSAKSVTISFWVRSNKTGVYCLQLQTNHYGGSDQYQQVREYTISAANTWEKKTLTFPGLTAQTIDTTNGDGLRLLWWLACGVDDHVAANSWTQSASYGATSNQVNFLDNANNEWYITGCQLEVGDSASDFEHRSFGEELSLCQRYYWNSYNGAAIGSNTGTTTAIGKSYATGNYGTVSQGMFPVTMRAQPTMVAYNPITGAAGSFRGDSSNFSSVSITFRSVNHFQFNSGNLAVGDNVYVSTHATADAEL